MNTIKNKIIFDHNLKEGFLKDSTLCYGHFNVVHPGHIRYLEYAKEVGEVLGVVIQSDSELKLNSEDHFFFTAKERALNLASLQIVDYVIVLERASLSEVIKQLKPLNLILGREFEYSKSEELIKATQELAEIGSSIIFHGGDVHYSQSMLTADVSLSEEKRQTYTRACRRQQITKLDLFNSISMFKNSSLLVIGDTIVDQYVACEGIGMSAEAPIVVLRELDEDTFLGGAGIVAAHARSLGAKCHFLSVVGADEKSQIVRRQMANFGINYSLLEDTSRPTTFKMRYLVEKQKMFRVSRLKEHNLNREIERKLLSQIDELSQNVNGILVCDFLYGVITPNVLKKIKDIAIKRSIPFYCDLQCSSQVGSIMKFTDCDLLCPTEREARIGIGAKDDGLEWVANQVMKKTNARNLIMKLGSDGFIAYEKQGADVINRQPFPALSDNPVDVTGAGDSLLAALAVGMSSGVSVMKSSAIAACMASLVVESIGNKPIVLDELKDRVEDFYV